MGLLCIKDLMSGKMQEIVSSGDVRRLRKFLRQTRDVNKTDEVPHTDLLTISSSSTVSTHASISIYLSVSLPVDGEQSSSFCL